MQAILATLPMIVIGVTVYLVGVLCTIYWSFTPSGAFPNWTWAGPLQYTMLWGNAAWLAAVRNLAVMVPVALAINVAVGLLLAILLDRNLRLEGLFRSIFLYPFALSLYVTGTVWRWIYNPWWGIERTIQDWGFADFHFAPLTDSGQALAGVIVAGAWQSIGLTMAILLAALRGVDPDIWKAARVDGIPAWRTYLFIVLPMVRSALAVAVVLQLVSIVRTYDLVVALAIGDPSRVTWMPAVYVIKAVWYDVSLRQGSAASTMLLLPVGLIVLIRAVWLWRRARRAGMNAAA